VLVLIAPLALVVRTPVLRPLSAVPLPVPLLVGLLPQLAVQI